mmetsp:Transcript_33836/g.45741  ORF Transcript_33836/g.45741 Transcript_33836/m.45741 type:complete len:350 (-) Transcript_33836:429-1478(-)|eukprot:CAMPEP_0185788982 /NCGR_PEP_ID=MMETSP1174-20130828/148742_1 /TAXON_ID=35687 /ORGANISM="Dictyocha speculum, Strain CCMP1381" /LENGTH=349 /DNA_ID=CAMNT_0028482913 /DNA_START=40 /DNA_END=1092 /DNA_ORIENTATION=+
MDLTQPNHWKVCIRTLNVARASIFISGFLRDFGSGRYTYFNHTACPSLSTDVEVHLDERPQMSWPTDREKYLIISSGDEFCSLQQVPTPFFSARQYYTEPDFRDSKLLYLPLGPRQEFDRIYHHDILMHPIVQRKYAVNLIASISTQPLERYYLGRNLTKWAKTDAVLRDREIFIHMSRFWSKQPGLLNKHLHPRSFREVLLNSIFTLCPTGHNPETYRIFEAVEAGSIPVICLNELYQNSACRDSFRPFLHTSAPFLVLRSWTELPQVLGAILANFTLISQWQHDMLAWRDRYWTSVSLSFEELLDCARESRPLSPASDSTVARCATILDVDESGIAHRFNESKSYTS